MSTTENPTTLGQIEVEGLSRGAFMRRGALTAGALAGAAAVGPFARSAAAQAGGDVEILNFALTLEYLEAEFYERHARRTRLSADVRKVASRFGDHESAHVDALTAAIKSAGGKPAAKPTFTFPVGNEAAFLKLAYDLENAGVSAYNGAGPSIKSTELLGAAGSIVQIEARHAAEIGVLADRSPTQDGAFDLALAMDSILAKVKPLIAG